MAQMIENLPATQGRRQRALAWEDPPERGKAAHSVFLLENQTDRSLAGYRPQDLKEIQT